VYTGLYLPKIPFSGFHQCNIVLHCAQNLPQDQFARDMSFLEGLS
jgi:hypothetical protein